LNEEFSSLLEEELPFVFLPLTFALSFGPVEAPRLDPWRLLTWSLLHFWLGYLRCRTSDELYLHPRSSTSPLQVIKLFFGKYDSDTN
jgi:hypothetical protein